MVAILMPWNTERGGQCTWRRGIIGLAGSAGRSCGSLGYEPSGNKDRITKKRKTKYRKEGKASAESGPAKNTTLDMLWGCVGWRGFWRKFSGFFVRQGWALR